MKTFNIEKYLDSLSNDIQIIRLSYKNLTYIPSLERFYKLKELNCSWNQLTKLPNLPYTLEILDCSDNLILNIPYLSNKLQILDCSNNKLTNISNLPNTLKILYCFNNNIYNIPHIPNMLQILNCNNNQITKLPTLSNSLKELYCCNNKLTRLPNLPYKLRYMYCNNNHLPFEDIESWEIFNKFKITFYTIKYGLRLERYYIKNIRNKIINKDFLEILYSPDFKFYKRLLDPTIQKLFY
jgi:Leucine-rich repeat (LRR) protein